MACSIGSRGDGSGFWLLMTFMILVCVFTSYVFVGAKQENIKREAIKYNVECYQPYKVYKNVKKDWLTLILEDGTKVELPYHYATNRCLFTEIPRGN